MINNSMIAEKLEKLNELEQNNSKILVSMYIKSIDKLKHGKVDKLEKYFNNQLKFYNQNIIKYNSQYEKELEKYITNIEMIINAYNELYINAQLELQEAESNQKIAILNLIKCRQAKESLLEEDEGDYIELEKYDLKIKEYLVKKEKYDDIIEICEEQMEKYKNDLLNQINRVFKDYSAEVISVNDDKIKKIFSKVVNIFVGSNRFKTYVMEPLIIENEKIENIIPDIISEIESEKVNLIKKVIKNDVSSVAIV